MNQIQITTVNTNSTAFEDLANEIIYEIFEFLDAYHVYEAFFNLNTRFQDLLTFSNFSIKVNIPTKSKSSFQHYFTQFITPNTHRISSLYISNSCMVNLIFSSLENTMIFTRLETLIFDNIDEIYLENLFQHLASLSKLSSLIINSVDGCCNKKILYAKIFRLPALKYCVLSVGDSSVPDPLPIAFDNFSPIEHLVINSKVYLDEFSSLLSYVPQLRRLSINYLTRPEHQRTKMFAIVLKNLTHISVKLERIKFNVFERFFTTFFPDLEVLRISTSNDNEYLNAKRWERVILSHMPRLRIFDIQHTNFLINNESDTTAGQTLMDQFSTSFWIERKWFFAYQHNLLEYSNRGIFYSTQPYRRKYYTLSGRYNPFHTERSLASVRHVHIENKSAINNCSIYFPNATELTVSGNVFMSRDPIKITVDRIIPLSQITKIIINGDYACFAEVIKMLRFIPNCYKLILNSPLPDGVDLLSLQSSENFRSLSSRNNITDVTVKSWCTLKKVKLVMHLCPRLQHLTINVLQEDLRSVIKYLLRKNDNTRHLHSLDIQSGGDIWIEKLMNMITEERQCDEVSVKVIGYCQCYLWW